jgi:hypothetical protein
MIVTVLELMGAALFEADIFAHVCRGVSSERAITDNANISDPFTYR